MNNDIDNDNHLHIDYELEQQTDELIQELNRRGLLDGTDPEDPRQIARTQKGGKLKEEARSMKVKRGVGKFYIPRENTWAAHREAVLDDEMQLRYATERYPYFDNIIHQKVRYRPVWDKNSSHFHGYDCLRENLAIVRNYIMCEFFPDGTVDEQDLKKVKHLAQIADYLADGMNNDKLFFNPFKTRISIDKANIPGTGAQYLYKHIARKQDYYSWLAPIAWPIALITGKTWKDWELPNLDESPFSDEALRMPPPADISSALSDDDILALAAVMDKKSMTPQGVSEKYAQGLDEIAEDFAHASTMYSGVDSLQEPTRRESVDLAKEILRKLKLSIGNALIENGLTASASSNFAILDALKGAVRVYEFNLHKVLALDPDIMKNPSVMAANNAIGKLGYIAKMEVLRVAQKSKDPTMARAIEAQILQMPKAWQSPQELRYGQLIEQLESGLDTVLLRINQIADKDTSTAQWLGFSNEKAIGGQDPTMQKKGHDSEKASADDQYYKQMNAQRAARAQQASISHSMNQQRKRAQEHDEDGHKGPNASARKQQPAESSKDTSMSGLLAKDQVASMRQSMQTDPNAQAVKVNQRQEVMRREKDRITRDQAAKMKTVEQVNRANQRNDKSHHDEPAHPATPPAATGPKKRDTSHGI